MLPNENFTDSSLSRTFIGLFAAIFALLFLFETKAESPFDSLREEKIVDNPLKAKASFQSATVAPGSQAKLLIHLNLSEGHKAYVDMFKIRWRDPEDAQVTGFTVDPSFKFEDKFSGKIREGMKDRAVLTAVVEFPENLPLGNRNTEFEFTYQACTESYCHFPKTIPFKLQMRVVDAAEFLPGSPGENVIQDSLF